MQNPLLQNNKTWVFEDLQHRTSHYNKILGARSTYNSSPKKRASFLDYVNCKHRVNSEETRRTENQKLVKSLLSIEKQGSRYLSRQLQFNSPKSLKNEYIEREQNNKIMGENLELYKKISGAAPSIGSKKQWKQRTKQLNKYNKLLKNKRSSYLQLDQQFFDSFNRIKNMKKSENTQLKFQVSRRSSVGKKYSQRFYTEDN